MNVALLRQRAALRPGSEPVPLGIVAKNVKLLARMIVEHSLDSEHVRCTMLRWLAQVETLRVAQPKKANSVKEEQELESLYRTISLGYKDKLGLSSWNDTENRVLGLLLLEESCLEYLRLVEELVEKDL